MDIVSWVTKTLGSVIFLCLSIVFGHGLQTLLGNNSLLRSSDTRWESNSFSPRILSTALLTSSLFFSLLHQSPPPLQVFRLCRLLTPASGCNSPWLQTNSFKEATPHHCFSPRWLHPSTPLLCSFDTQSYFFFWNQRLWWLLSAKGFRELKFYEFLGAELNNKSITIAVFNFTNSVIQIPRK